MAVNHRSAQYIRLMCNIKKSYHFESMVLWFLSFVPSDGALVVLILLGNIAFGDRLQHCLTLGKVDDTNKQA